MESAWLVVGDTIYDATDYLSTHPGGKQSILKKSGGVDCSVDMEFHSRKAIGMMKRKKVGKLVKCSREIVLSETQDGCAVM
jgi:cytochrome b involved in lipid metabolism